MDKLVSILEYENSNHLYNEILKNLTDENSDDFSKIFSILNLSEIKSKVGMDIVINFLTNHSDPLREAVAYKLDEIYKDEYFDDFLKEKFLKAIIDINPNVSRAVCSLILKHPFLKENLEYDIILKIQKLLSEIKKCKQDSTNNKSHARNKNLFSLYWLLEVLSLCVSDKYYELVLEIVTFTITFSDYTIREKTAKILGNMSFIPNDLLQIAKSDQNFYVKNQVYGKINFDD